MNDVRLNQKLFERLVDVAAAAYGFGTDPSAEGFHKFESEFHDFLCSGAIVLAVEPEGIPVGSPREPVGVLLYYQPSPHVVSIQYLAVMPEFQRQGLGADLLMLIEKAEPGKLCTVRSDNRLMAGDFLAANGFRFRCRGLCTVIHSRIHQG